MPGQLHARVGRARVDDQEKLALIEIHQLGGIINFWADEGISQDEVKNVLLGGGWSGGEESLKIFHKVPSLKSLLLVEEAGISSGAVDKLQAQMPNLNIKLSKIYPVRPGQHTRCFFNIFNRSGKEVVIYWVDFKGELSFRTNLPPNGEHRMGSYIGHKWEAHADGKRISKCAATPERVWVIKLDK
ncbi:MAG: hypothetical protein IH986_11050 [Planctomycetes bacterium]|nr:hypothetical protein [Planctomycetota bacterium]